ncbi:MAG: radical SAM protein [Spirulinaceae cyanobacterium SM2_1_0]|nr:radical SAM protein [Spirulinaceae cyanobacterium SM2_1_0]
MQVKMILPALTEAKSPFWRPIKYHLFPPLGLATIASHFGPDDDIDLQDEHVEPLDLDDDPDLVVIQVYITNAYRAYAIADQYRDRGVYVVLGGLHVTALPEEARAHADTLFLGPGEDTWPVFLRDFRAGAPQPRYRSRERSLVGVPPLRRDLIKRHLYLVPNSLVVSRGCPHHCDFCYKDAFYAGGKSFYTQTVDAALAEIDQLPGRHLYFLDDHLFGNAAFASELFAGMKGMGRVWQAAATVTSILKPGLLEQAAAAGLRSLFVGFETLNSENLREQNKYHNLNRDYTAAVQRLRDAGVMINGSFVFGMDSDDETVFSRTVDWAVSQGIETATFHIMTPYPSTPLYERLQAQGRITSTHWDHYDTRHVVYQPMRLSPAALEAGYWQAYRDFYRWEAIFRGASVKSTWPDRLRHIAYAGGWKKCEPIWDLLIRAKQVNRLLPALEQVLASFGEPPPVTRVAEF